MTTAIELGHLGAEFLQMLCHCLGIGGGHDHGGTDAPGRTYGTKDVGGIVPIIAYHQRS
jgi:hypothetical protein